MLYVTIPPLGRCGQAEEDNKQFDSVWNDQSEGQTAFGVPSSNKDNPCLPGCYSELTMSGNAVHGLNGDGDHATTEEKTGENETKKKHAHRATLYTNRYKGILYHVPINSSLGETYRSLVDKAERLEFMMKNGEERPSTMRCPYSTGGPPHNQGK